MGEEQKPNLNEIAMDLQVKKAESMEIPAETVAFLQGIRKQNDWRKLEWYYLCAIDRMPLAELRMLETKKCSVMQIRQKRQEYLKKICVGLEPMHNRIRDMEAEVKSVCEESRRMKSILEDNIEKALEKQYEAQGEALKAKDKNIFILEEQLRKFEEENKQLRKQQQGRQKEGEKDQLAQKEYRAEESISKPQQKQDIRRGCWNKIKQHLHPKESTDSRKFIDTYIKDEKYSEEQKNFFLDCMEEGMTVSDISDLAAHNLSVDVMKRLKKMKEKE